MPETLMNNETVTYADEEFGRVSQFQSRKDSLYFQVQFKNGTRVKEVSFQCKWDQAWCGMQCCDKEYESVCDGDCSIK